MPTLETCLNVSRVLAFSGFAVTLSLTIGLVTYLAPITPCTSIGDCVVPTNTSFVACAYSACPGATTDSARCCKSADACLAVPSHELCVRWQDVKNPTVIRVLSALIGVCGGIALCSTALFCHARQTLELARQT